MELVKLLILVVVAIIGLSLLIQLIKGAAKIALYAIVLIIAAAIIYTAITNPSIVAAIIG